MRTSWRAVLSITVGLLAVAGCSAAQESSAPSQAQPGAVAGNGGAPPIRNAAPDAGKAQVTAPQPGAADRKLARTARLELSAQKVPDAVSQARSIAEAAGGYTGQETTQDTTATLTLAVPADKLDGVLDQLAHLGTAVKREMNTQDVTSQVIDVDARLATQRASVDRIRALLDKATSISDISSIEGELTNREATLESLEQQQKSLAGSVAMATVNLTVNATAAAPPPKPDHSGFFGGLSAGWDAFLTFGSGLLTVLGALAPFLIILAPAAWLAWRTYRRRRTPAQPAPEPTQAS